MHHCLIRFQMLLAVYCRRSLPAMEGERGGNDAPAGPGTGAPFPHAGAPSITAFQNITLLSQISGIPMHLLNNVGMQRAAQQLAAQRVAHQQLLASRYAQLSPVPVPHSDPRTSLLQPGAPVPVADAPLPSSHAMSQPSGRDAPASSREIQGSSGPAEATRAAEEGAVTQGMATTPAPLDAIEHLAEQHGARDHEVVWVKVGSYPWWPAKVLDPVRDVSFPDGAISPRRGATPVRFFGTWEFTWVANKSAVVGWKEVSCGLDGSKVGTCMEHRCCVHVPVMKWQE